MPPRSTDADQRISDELASAYLRDRSAACPRCAYPLRDATSRTCPECACTLGLVLTDAATGRSPHRLLRTMLGFIALFAAFSVIANTASLIYTLVLGEVPATLIDGALYFGAHLAWLAILFWSVRLWSRARKGIAISATSAFRAASACIVMSCLGAAMHIYSAILALSTVL